MREIKFRAVIDENTTIYFDFGTLLESKFSNRELLWPWLDAGNIPDQYTGFKDKSGKEIYESDIVMVCRSADHFGVKNYSELLIIGSPVYEQLEDESSGGPYGSDIAMEMTILGNIYQNSELLGAEDE